MQGREFSYRIPESGTQSMDAYLGNSGYGLRLRTWYGYGDQVPST